MSDDSTMSRKPKRKRKFGKQQGAHYYQKGPAPSTARGKRRHQRKSDDHREHAMSCWITS